MKKDINSNTTSIHLNTEKALKITPTGLSVGDKEVSLDGHIHEEFNHTHEKFTNNLKTMTIEPIVGDEYNLGGGTFAWNQVKANYYIGLTVYGKALAEYNKASTKIATNEADLSNILDNISIEVPVGKAKLLSPNKKLWINVSGLGHSNLRDLFVRDEEDGSYVSESSLLALALQEIKNLKQEVKELKI